MINIKKIKNFIGKNLNFILIFTIIILLLINFNNFNNLYESLSNEYKNKIIEEAKYANNFLNFEAEKEQRRLHRELEKKNSNKIDFMPALGSSIGIGLLIAICLYIVFTTK